MQRMAWTDERLEERFDAIDRHFDQIDRRFDQVDRRFDRLEDEMRAGFATLQSLLNRTGAGIVLGLVGVIGAILAQGI